MLGNMFFFFTEAFNIQKIYKNTRKGNSCNFALFNKI